MTGYINDKATPCGARGCKIGGAFVPKYEPLDGVAIWVRCGCEALIIPSYYRGFAQHNINISPILNYIMYLPTMVRKYSYVVGFTIKSLHPSSIAAVT